MRPVFVGGLGLWSPRFSGVTAYVGRQPSPAEAPPAATLLSPALRRRASRLTRMAAEVAGQACAEASADPRDLLTVYGSAYGEFTTALEILKDMAMPEGLPSPTSFHNSVHNAASGAISIAWGNRALSTALAAGRETAAMGLLEAMALLAVRGGEALLVLADELPWAPFTPAEPFAPLALAFHLASEQSPASRARLEPPVRGGPAAADPDSTFGANPVAPALGLLAAVASARRGRIGLSPAGGAGWSVEVCEVGT